MSGEGLYQIALTQVPMIGAVHRKTLIEHFGSAKAIFTARTSYLERIGGIGATRARSIRQFTDFSLAEKELRFIEKYNIKKLFFTDADFPSRLKHCYDPPVVLYYKGTVSLNSAKLIGIVGTRNNSEYGRVMTENMVRELQQFGDLVIISGLASGIDALAHKSAILNGIPTVGVLAHGLDTIYPGNHSSLARSMLHEGGLLTEFPSNTRPDRHNFPSRNRIVAGLCDALVVIETGMKGGSMITADLAVSYNRDVFAFPGRITDSRSAGCNYLIQQQKAELLLDTTGLLETMGWIRHSPERVSRQSTLFPELSEKEKIVVDILTDKGQLGVDELKYLSRFTHSELSTVMLELEMKNVIESLPGKIFGIR